MGADCQQTALVSIEKVTGHLPVVPSGNQLSADL